MPRFSLIIPAHNEQDYLPALLDTVETARANYPGGAQAIEVIVADNGSADRTARIARTRGCRVVPVEKRVIAASRNAGAGAARGEILAFVDADSRIHPRTFHAIDQAISDPKVVAGATGVIPERISMGIAVTYLLLVPLVWITGIDAGVVFCRKQDFDEIGGYNEAKRFAEDLDFLWRLRQMGRRHGQKLTRLRSTKAVASVRKFDQYGDWHYFSVIAWGLYGLLVSPDGVERMARKYWYDKQRS